MRKKHHVEHRRQNAHKECLVCLKKKKLIPLLFIKNHTFVVMFFFMFIKTNVLPPPDFSSIFS